MQLLKHVKWLALLVPALVCVWLRLLHIGGPPFTDGGTYHYNAWLASEVGGSLPTAPIGFYSWLASFVGQDIDAPFWRARAFDAAFAGGASAALAWLLLRVTRWQVATLLASSWAVCMAAPVFTDAGFKNPIAAASLPFFCAVALLLGRHRQGCLRAGVLVAAACLLREAFAPAAVLVPLLAFARHGLRGALRSVAGGAVGGALIIVWMFAAGVSPTGALANLSAQTGNANALLEATNTDPAKVRVDSFWLMLDHTWFLLLPAAIGVLALLTGQRRLRRNRAWLAAITILLMPLPQILGQFCVAYRWAQLLPALLLIAATGDRRLHAFTRLRHWPLARPTTWLATLAACWFATATLRLDLERGRYWHSVYRHVMLDGNWSIEPTTANRYLQIAAWLRNNSKPDATLMVSGYGYALYPLSQRRPANINVSDLTFSRLTEQAKTHPEWIEALRATPPDFVLETQRWPEPLQDVWPDFEERYELATEWPRDDAVHYGNFPARLWRRR